VPYAISGNAANGARYNPSEGQFGGSGATNPVYYNEGFYVGYRYYDTFNVPVAFPFGHGLSYTKFDYSEAKLGKATFDGVSDKLTASVKVTNTGSVAGKEVVQFYVGAPGVQLAKPVKELKGYEKTRLLQPGESETITVEFNAMSLASYADRTVDGAVEGDWPVEKGHYVVYFASSSQDIRATRSFVVPGGFIARQVNANAMKPTAANQTTLDANTIRPTQIKVTFRPLPGAAEGASFEKAYSVMNGSYNYLPELPAGYGWFIDGTDSQVYEDSMVTLGDKTLVAGRDSVRLTLGDPDVTATVVYDNNSAQAMTATLVVALYDIKGKLISVSTKDAPVAAGAAAPLELSTAVDNAATIRGFLWNGASFTPLVGETVRPVYMY
jgi:hypothetical protein